MTVETSEGGRPQARRRRASSRRVRRFYEQALSEAERGDFEAALAVAGVEQEIAVLRLRLREALAENPGNFSLMLRGIDMLARLVARRYLLPEASVEQLAAAYRETLLGAGAGPASGDGHG